MLVKIWERLRGIDKWPQTTATVTEITYDSLPRGGHMANVAFRYRDPNGEDQYWTYTVDSMTSLYNIQPNDTFSVWFNPKRPEQNFSDEIESTANRTLVIILFAAVMIALIVFVWIFRR